MVAEKNDEKMTRVAPEGRADSLKLGDTGLDFWATWASSEP